MGISSGGKQSLNEKRQEKHVSFLQANLAVDEWE